MGFVIFVPSSVVGKMEIQNIGKISSGVTREQPRKGGMKLG